MTNEELEKLERFSKETPLCKDPADAFVMTTMYATALAKAAPALIAAARENAKLRAVVEAVRRFVDLRDTDQSLDWVERELEAEEALKKALSALDAKENS